MNGWPLYDSHWSRRNSGTSAPHFCNDKKKSNKNDTIIQQSFSNRPPEGLGRRHLAASPASPKPFDGSFPAGNCHSQPMRAKNQKNQSIKMAPGKISGNER